MITGDRLELGHEPASNAAYVKSWVQALHDDPREIYRAAKDAYMMSDYLLGPERERDPARTDRNAAARPAGEPDPVLRRVRLAAMATVPRRPLDSGRSR